MKLGVSGAKIEIVAASGVLRVRVSPRQHWLWILSEAVLIAVFGGYAARYWAAMPSMLKVFSAWGIGGAIVAWLYQLSGSEVIEFDATGIRIRKDILGWERLREYQIKDCSELDVHPKGDGDDYGIQCKVGWRTIRFGEYVSEDQANEIFSVLRRDLPNVAARLGASPTHFTTLGLNSGSDAY
jgi:hypothetical protein